ncbi:hypothetical protein [Saccharothrix syringae]|uniref:Tetratricopeptide repeat protein n=1 Tax=Saccharothrix syringae TaxID=103733 RepID=A0A5Q0H474_SACSY|nr:hypothetical protein [Saccharothrix syringae]QFZ21011.1 hypothetical protein EKG83_29760 [Saccharothrix syringae]
MAEELTPEQVAELRARAGAGNRNAAGRLGEVLAGRGDLDGALRVWAEAYGDESPTTKRLAEVLAEQGDLGEAVNAWRFSDVVWQNPEGGRQAWMDALPADERADWQDDPEDWGFMEAERLARLLAERGDAAAVAELRARAEAGDAAAARELAD